MTLTPRVPIGMFGLGLGYFLWYTPYSAVAKAMSGGLLGVTSGPIGGLVLLPAAALGMLCAMPLTLTVLGWWKHARHRSILGRSVPFPGRETAASAFWMALIVGSTTLNFTFLGGSILFMLVLMRIETLIISPTVDLVRGRKIHLHSWIAVGLSLASAAVALADVTNYRLATMAVISLLAYFIGYSNRFLLMSRHAKAGQFDSDRRYLVEEHMTTPVILVALLGLPALLGWGEVSLSLREGFTTFLATPAALPAFAIGVFYEGLFVFTTLIFLDRREYSFCMPVHVCSSMLAGVAASLALSSIFGIAPPSTATFIASVCVVLAAFALSYPAIRARIVERIDERWRRRQALLFVCGGNTIRSPMAAALARMELVKVGVGRTWQVWSAGITVHEPGKPLAEHAASALRQLEVPVPKHAARPITRSLCVSSTAVYCMTKAHRDAVVQIVPEASDRIVCLDPQGDLPEPHGESLEAHLDLARRIQSLVRRRLLEQFKSQMLEHLVPYARVLSSGGI